MLWYYSCQASLKLLFLDYLISMGTTSFTVIGWMAKVAIELCVKFLWVRIIYGFSFAQSHVPAQYQFSSRSVKLFLKLSLPWDPACPKFARLTLFSCKLVYWQALETTPKEVLFCMPFICIDLYLLYIGSLQIYEVI